MSEQAGSSVDESPISTGSLVSLALRFAMKALESSGNERAKKLAHLIDKAPEILGEKTGLYVKSLLEKRAAGKELTKEDSDGLSEKLSESPEQSAAVLGFFTAELLEGAHDAATERKEILNSYNSIFEIICIYMRQTKSSVALKGFIHDEHCISYWHFDRSNLEFSLSGDYLFPNGLEIYLLHEEPTDHQLALLNLEISDSASGHLPQNKYEFTKTDLVSKVEKIYKASILFIRLHPDRESLPKRTKEPLFGGSLGTDYSKPIGFTTSIPPGSQYLIGLIESLYIAREAQMYRSELLKQVQSKVANIHTS
jgi:hypothetical protein